jgi:hypothetical protein
MQPSLESKPIERIHASQLLETNLDHHRCVTQATSVCPHIRSNHQTPPAFGGEHNGGASNSRSRKRRGGQVHNKFKQAMAHTLALILVVVASLTAMLRKSHNYEA